MYEFEELYIKDWSNGSTYRRGAETKKWTRGKDNNNKRKAYVLKFISLLEKERAQEKGEQKQRVKKGAKERG